MRKRLATLMLLLASACGVAPQPESAQTVAAFEVPLPTKAARVEFLQLLDAEAHAYGYHVDSATEEELDALSDITPMSMNATVWRGKDDVEPIASAMDFKDHLGRIWISFSKGEKPQDVYRFRSQLIPKIQERWPETTSLPIMPTGAIPLPKDLVRTPSGYVVNPAAKQTYQLSNHE